MPRAMEANAAPASTASRRRKSSPTGQSSTEGAATWAMSAARLDVVPKLGRNPVCQLALLLFWNEKKFTS